MMTDLAPVTNLTKQKAPFLQHKTSSPRLPTTCHTLILLPHNSHFQTKTLELRDSVHLTIGRQTNSKTVPGALNGYFDSKVLSRTHAEIWNDKGKIYIKDVKSSNGTFLNGRRLSAECTESAPTEIRNDDQLEFGIDITNDDGSVLYHKVSCNVRLFSVPLSQVDPAFIKDLNLDGSNGMNMQLYPDSPLQRKSSTPSISTISASSYSSSNNLSASSFTGSGTFTIEKRSRNWEHVLNKLQNELQRSQEVEAELRSMKDSIQNVEQVYNDEQIKNLSTHNAALQKRWQESQQQVASYAEKCRHQDRAIKSAQQELVRLQKTIQQLQTLRKNDEELNNLKHEMEAQKLAFEEEKIELNRQLHAERARCIEQEDAYLTLAKRLKHADLHYKPGFMDALQIRGVQVLFGILLGIVSALLYSLSNWSSTNSEVICPP